jgi:hypothetical protein
MSVNWFIKSFTLSSENEPSSNQGELIKLLKEINSDDELINTQSVIEENLKKIQEQRMLEAQSHINPAWARSEPSSLAEISVPSMKFCSVCNFILKSNIDLLFLVSDTQIGKTPPSAEQVRMNEEQFQSDKQTIYNMLKIGFLSSISRWPISLWAKIP